MKFPAADRDQQKRVFGRLSDGFSLFDQQTCLLCGCLGFRRGIPLDVHEGSCKRDLKLDLLAAQCRRGGQSRNLGKGTGELRPSLHQRRALERPLSRFAPQAGLLDLPGLGSVMPQQLRRALGNFDELAFERFGDAGEKRSPRLA